MKLAKLLFAAILPIIIHSCESKPYPRLMQTAESLADTYPDSASTLLDVLQESISKEPEATRMYHRLLSIRANEDRKEYFLSDSLVKPLLEYYEKRKDKKQLPEVYYYAGKTYRELGDTPQAQDYLQKALKASEKDADHRLLYKIHRQLAMTYHHNLRRPAESIAPFKNACRHAVLSGDSLLMANALRDIARGFQNVNIDSLSFYYQKTIDMARQMHNDNLRSIVYIELGQCYFQEQAYQKACDALQASHNPLMLPSVYYLARANVFNETGRPDSARYYAEKVLSTGNTYANIDAYYSNRQKAYSLLSTITAKQGNPAKALEYMRHCLMYDDSLQEARRVNDLRQLNARYNYQFREKENRRLEDITKQQEARIIILSASIGFMSLFILSALIIYLLRKKQKTMQAERQREKLKSIATEQYQSSKLFISANEERIIEIKRKLQDTESQKDEMQKTLQKAEQELLELTNRRAETKQKIQAISEQTFKESQIYKDFYHVAGMPGSETISGKKKISSKDWEELTEAINKTYNGFTARLQDLYPAISEHEMRICILLKMAIPPTSIADITAHSKQAITSSRRKLYKKTHSQDGTPDLWDRFIQNF